MQPGVLFVLGLNKGVCLAKCSFRAGAYIVRVQSQLMKTFTITIINIHFFIRMELVVAAQCRHQVKYQIN